VRRLVIALAVLLPAAFTIAADPPDPVVESLPDFEDARPEVHQRAIDRLIETADAARVLKMARIGVDVPASDDAERVRYGGAAYGIELARRYAATELGSVARWMTLEELMRSAWKGHATSVLRRAGLSERDAARVLIERAQARLACQECFDQALADDHAQNVAVAEVARRGHAVVPQALGVLAVAPWIAASGWPEGPTVMKQRVAVKIVTMAKARVAVPYLLQHVDAPSAMLQFDVLRALTELTGDAAWAASDLSKLDALSAQRTAWWKREGSAYGEAARWFALDGLQLAADYQFAVVRGSKVDPYQVDASPNPLAHLFKTIELLTGRQAPDDRGIPCTRLWDVVEAIRHFEGLE